jgi:DNA invertase Pin-like site-specific DNA recombinase
MGRTTKTSADPGRVVAYLRVSTDDQTLGPEAQRAAVERWCATHGATLVATFEDHVSGGAAIEKRPGLVAALDALVEHGAGVLLVAKRDRLARDPIIAAMTERLVERAGARVLSAAGEGTEGDDPAAVLMRRMIDAFAEYERALIRARTRAALGVKRGRGERVGQVPFGFRLGADGVHLEAHDEEQRAVVRVRTLRAEGLSLDGVAARLNAEGVPARGERWYGMTVGRILARPAA